MRSFSTLLLLLVTAAASAHAADDAQRAAMKFFESEVRPVLVSRCYECHSDKKQKGGLRVDHIGYLKKGGDTGAALIPGNPEKSAMIEAIRFKNEDFQMPPKHKLPDAEIALLEKWVKIGAPWPEDAANKVVITEGGFTEDQRNYWCFKPVANITPPALPKAWGRNEIDGFVAQKLAENHLDPAPEADRHELVRRVYFDLHGLPPTREQVETFVNDQSPRAYEKLVDELLASPRYGERWAQHWLDLVRYAESDGYNADAYRPSVWPYRDYVIKSFNDDKPYDRFVREQLAGDEIAPNDPNVMIATSFLRHPVYEWNQRDVRGQWDIILTDMTDTTGELFLGLSMGCAHCHNHKFDPILQKDYYRLRAFLAPVKWRDDVKLATPAEKSAYAKQQAEWEAATAGVRAKLEALTKPLLEPKVERALTRFTEDLQGMVRKPAGARGALESQLAGLCERQLEHERTTFDPMKSLKSEDAKAAYKALEAELKSYDTIKPKPLLDAFVATDAGLKPPSTTMKTRKGEQEIAPGFLTLLEPQEPKIKPIGNSTGRRTALANWITRPDNQLSTRVIVNRVWQYHFGRGIVATASDFGKLGEKPTHPELLDWLTKRFVANGWHLKSLHRDIMLSSAYRQTARREPSETALKVDPSNRYLWRFNPRRLDAEQIRDALLAASGELDPKAGGPAEDGNGTRRSIYTMKKRNNQNELLRSLDAPAGFASTAERQSTTTPTQALQLINGDWLMTRARKLSSHVENIDDAWLAVLGRPPSDSERETAEGFLKKRSGSSELPVAIKQDDSSSAVGFKENTEHERVLVQGPPKEGDDFTVEAIVMLNSIDVNAAVRTIVSRWTGGKDSIESFGWSLGVTGEKSRFKPRNLIVQLVGEDENSNIGYEVVASDLRLELGHHYHIVARISCSDRNVSFIAQDLDVAGSKPQAAVVPHAIRSKLGAGAAALVIGGLNKRTTAHQWDGQIDALRIASGLLPDEALSTEPNRWNKSIVSWNAAAGPNDSLTWMGNDHKSSEGTTPFQQAMNDLCQVLLNTNEFFYLH